MSLIEKHAKVAKQHPKMLHFIQAGSMIHAYNEDAILLNRICGYQLTLQGKSAEPYVKTAFKASAVNIVMSLLREKARLMSAVYIEDDEGQNGLRRTKTLTFRNYMSKEEFVDSSDVASEIQKKIDYQAHEETRLLQGLRTKRNDRFELHAKANKLHFWLNLCVSKYMPKIFRSSYGVQLITFWGKIVEGANKLRNIPVPIKEKPLEYQKAKERIFFEISVSIDTLKDVIDAVWNIKGWKNARQYRFVRTRLDELGRIAGGLIVKNNQLAKLAVAS